MSREYHKINASFVEYGSPNHKPLGNYSFKFTNDEMTSLSITKPNGEILENLKLGDQLADIGTIELDDANDLIVGKYKIYQGEKLIPGWTAKRSTGKTVKITDPQGVEHKGTVGEYFRPLNGFISGKDEYGNLSFNDGQYTMKHLVKTKTVALTVKKDMENGGYKGSIKETRPKNLGGSRASVPIIFYGKKANAPAYFTTKNAGVDVAIGIFHLSEDKNSTKLCMFSPDVALELKMMKTRMAAISRECHQFQINTQDHQEFVRLKERASEIKNDAKPIDFTVSIGQAYFGMNYQKKPRKNNERSFARY